MHFIVLTSLRAERPFDVILIEEEKNVALPKLRHAFEVDAASISFPEPALPGQRTL